MSDPVKKNNRMLDHARKLRREMTPQERKLWYCSLRKYPVKIDKQRIIDSFIADFYCASAREIDREFSDVCTEIDRNIRGGQMKA